MAIPKPSEARIVVRHYEDGKLSVFLDGKPMPGVLRASLSQEGGLRAELNLTIIGLAVRLETSPHKKADDPCRQPQAPDEPITP